MSKLNYILRKESEYEFAIVEILEDQPRFKLKKGQWYNAKLYWVDPEKCTLLNRVAKTTGKQFKRNPMCNQYIASDIKIIKKFN
jgi:hypothetical protein